MFLRLVKCKTKDPPMFEFEDAKLGKIKVVNITEARSAIAKIMQDRDTSYIITKNNRPVRVIVNFEIFKKIKPAEVPPRSRATDQKSLKGIIQSRHKDLKEQVSRAGESFLETKPQSPVDQPQEFKLAVNAPEVQDIMVAPPDDVSDGQVAAAEHEITQDLGEDEQNPEQRAYFEKFKKLYQNADQAAGVSRTLAKDAQAKKGITEGVSYFASESTAEQPFQTKVSPGPAKGALSPHEPPSIQDLLRELEMEKLSGEDDETLSPGDSVRGLLNKFSE